MEKFQIDDLAKYKFLSGVKHSPDGKHACFVAHQANAEENKYISNLWILDLTENNYFQLTTFDSEKDFQWLDNDSIIFPAVRDVKDKEKLDAGDEYTQYYRINIHGGEAVKYFRIPRRVNSIKKLDDHRYVFTSEYNLYQKELRNLSDSEKTEELKRRKEEKDYEVLDEIPFWSNGKGFTNKRRTRLYEFDSITGRTEAITGEYSDVERFNVNADCSQLVLICNSFTDKMDITNDIMLYNINKRKLSKLNTKAKLNYHYADFINDCIILSGNDQMDYGINENNKFFIIHLGNLNMTCITPGLDESITNSVGSDCRYGSSTQMQVDGDFLYFVTTEGCSSYLNRIDTKGNINKIITDEGSIDGISIKEGNILYIGMKANSLQELYYNDTQVTKLNDWIHTSKKVSVPEKVIFESEPGLTIEGFVIRPVDFNEKRKYPSIFEIHGGPKTVYGTVFFHEMQCLASAGYAVFFCNPRGSDGRGNEFADIRGKYGTIDYKDLMKFTDEVIKRYDFIDKDRIGVTGGSYGGFMTNWIIGHTDRFRAAVSQRSISNWVSKFNTTDIGYFFVEDQNAATPWINSDKLWEHSPLKYADKVKTPTLFLHSEEDYRCWLAEGIQMFTALKYHGVEARLCMFRGENHELSRSGKPKHRIRRLKELTGWFDKYLKV